MIPLPQLFKNDIDSDVTNITTILRIQDENEQFFISTQKGMFGTRVDLTIADDVYQYYFNLFMEWWEFNSASFEPSLYGALTESILADPDNVYWTGIYWDEDLFEGSNPWGYTEGPFTWIEWENAQEVGIVYVEDRDLKISKIQEGINLNTKKITLSSISITISNAEIDGEILSDKLQRVLGNAVLGKKVSIYYKTQSAKTLDECLKVAEAKITRYDHNDDKVNLTADDTSLETFYVDLPLAKYHYYNEDSTFELGNGKPVPILYGHLQNAPTLLYIRNKDTENYYVSNNLLLLFDNSYFTGESIGGVKQVEVDYDQGWQGGFAPSFVDRFNALKISIGDIIYEVPAVNFIGTRQAIKDAWTYPQYVTNHDHIELTTDHDGNPTKLQQGFMWINDLVYAGLPEKAFKTLWTSSIQENNFENLRGWALSTSDVLQLMNGDPNYQEDGMIGSPNDYNLMEHNNNCSPFLRVRSQRIWGDHVFGDANPPEYSHLDEDIWGDYDDTWINQWMGVTFPFPAFEGSVDIATYKDANDNDRNYATDFILGGRFIVNQEDWTDNDFDDFAYLRVAGSTEAPYLPNGLIDQNSAWDEAVGIPPNVVADFNDESYYLYSQVAAAMNRQSYKWLTGPHATWSSGEGYHNISYFRDNANANFLGDHWNTWQYREELADKSVPFMDCGNFTFYIFANYYDNQENQTLVDVNFSVLGLNAKRLWLNKEIYSKNFYVNAKGRLGEESMPLIQERTHSQIFDFDGTIKINLADRVGNYEQGEGHNYGDHLYHIYNYFLSRPEAKFKYFDGQKYELMIETPCKRYPDSDTSYVYIHDIDVKRQEVMYLDPLTLGDSGHYAFYINAKVVKVFHGGMAFPDGHPTVGDTPYEFGCIDPTDVYPDDHDYWNDPLQETIPYPEIGEGEHPIKLVYARFKKNITNSVTGVYVARNIVPSIEYQINNSIAGAFNDESNVRIITNHWWYNNPSRELITNPVEVTRNLLVTELGYNDAFDEVKYLESRIYNSNIQLEFSLYKDIESKKVMEKIGEQSLLTVRYRPRDGKIVLDTLKPKYNEEDVNGVVAVDDLIKYKYNLTPIEKVSMQSQVLYGYNYETENLDNSTNVIQSPETYAIHYDILNQFGEWKYENYLLTTEADYIQDVGSAEFLNLFKHEYNKNQKLIIDLEMTLRDGLQYEVGDIIKFDKDFKTKPYGHSIVEERILIDQKVYPYFMVTKVGKKSGSCSVKIQQLHELNLPEPVALGDVVQNYYGCTNPDATNYDPQATIDDGSCVFPDGYFGCTDPTALNYNPDSQVEDGTCEYTPGTIDYEGPVGANEAATIEWIWSMQFRRFHMINSDGQEPNHYYPLMQGQYWATIPVSDYYQEFFPDESLDPYDGDYVIEGRRNIWGWLPSSLLNMEGTQGAMGLGLGGGHTPVAGTQGLSSYFTRYIADNNWFLFESEGGNAEPFQLPINIDSAYRRFTMFDMDQFRIMHQINSNTYVDYTIPNMLNFALTGDPMALYNMQDYILNIRDQIDLASIDIPEGEGAEVYQDLIGFPPSMIEALNIDGSGMTDMFGNLITLMNLISDDDDTYGEW